jgi:hypothetical protein
VVRAPAKPKFKVAIIGLDVPGGNDKDMKGRRFDSVPIANGIVKHGMQCDLIKVRLLLNGCCCRCCCR